MREEQLCRWDRACTGGLGTQTVQGTQSAQIIEEENLEAAQEMHGKLLQSEDCDLTSLLCQNRRSKRFLCLSRYLEKVREMTRFLRMLLQDAGPASTALWLRDFLCS